MGEGNEVKEEEDEDVDDNPAPSDRRVEIVELELVARAGPSDMPDPIFPLLTRY